MPLLIAVIVITILYACGRRGVMQKKHCVQAVTVLLTIFSGFRSWWMGDLIKYYTLHRLTRAHSPLSCAMGK